MERTEMETGRSHAPQKQDPDQQQKKPHERRQLFHRLAQLSEWNVPLNEALTIAAGASDDSALRGHIFRFKQQVETGMPLSDAMTSETEYWGSRTIDLIREEEPHELNRAFRRLASGATENNAMRLLRSAILSIQRKPKRAVTALFGIAVLFAPVIPYRTNDNGSVSVLGHTGPGDIYQPLSTINPDATGMSPDEWTTHSFYKSIRNASKKTGIKALGRQGSEIDQCISGTVFLTAQLTRDYELASMLNSLEASPVPAIWLERRVVNSIQTAVALPASVDVHSQAKILDNLASKCPALEPTN